MTLYPYPRDFMRSPIPQAARQRLELDVQNLVGPIVNIADLSDAQLYGIRDRRRRNSDAALGYPHAQDVAD